jgi:hypothetical protein
MKWHRWAGLAAALFVLLLCVTGVVLNHGAALGLARLYLQSPWLLDLYGVGSGPPPVAFGAGEHYVALSGDRVYFGDRALGERAGALVGAVALPDGIAVALPDRLLLLTSGGDLVETLRAAEGVPADIRRIGVGPDGRLVVDAAAGRLAPDLDTLHWEAVDAAGVAWAEPVPLPAAIAGAITADARAHTLTLERVLLDLHSGRIATRFGAWFMDLVALTLISLVLSGLWIWWRR